ncbi:MAG TPA: hypothetical protein VN901_07820 [Candidatus Acidoferrales bacterium]|nr:hypothetical protein [Candidatus Acidoferrales bacterium]
MTKLFGPDEAKVAADNWLDESDLMDSPPRSEARDLALSYDRCVSSTGGSGRRRPVSAAVGGCMN